MNTEVTAQNKYTSTVRALGERPDPHTPVKKLKKKEEKKIYKGREKRRLSVHARELLKLEAERKGR